MATYQTITETLSGHWTELHLVLRTVTISTSGNQDLKVTLGDLEALAGRGWRPPPGSAVPLNTCPQFVHSHLYFLSHIFLYTLVYLEAPLSVVAFKFILINMFNKNKANAIKQRNQM